LEDLSRGNKHKEFQINLGASLVYGINVYGQLAEDFRVMNIITLAFVKVSL
jgi:hypothetical protein